MAITKYYSGSSWVEARMKAYLGSVWEEVPKYYTGSAWEDLNAQTVVTLTGASHTAFNIGSDAIAYFWLEASGQFSKQSNAASRVQINVFTDWVIPNGAAPGSYRGKYSGLTGDTGDFSASLGTGYGALTSDKYVAVTDSTPGIGTKSISLTLHIDDGSVEQDTGAYTLTADREDF